VQSKSISFIAFVVRFHVQIFHHGRVKHKFARWGCRISAHIAVEKGFYSQVIRIVSEAVDKIPVHFAAVAYD
jgi:hypothetical protein